MLSEKLTELYRLQRVSLHYDQNRSTFFSEVS